METIFTYQDAEKIKEAFTKVWLQMNPNHPDTNSYLSGLNDGIHAVQRMLNGEKNIMLGTDEEE